MNIELKGLKEFVTNSSNEDAKRHLIYPFFKKLFGNEFKTESSAEGADGYIEGKLLIELKSKYSDWLSGLYQGLHYQKLGLSFPYICVVSYKFIGLWNLEKIPSEVLDIAYESDSQIRPSTIGPRNASKTNSAIATRTLDQSFFLLTKHDFSDALFQDRIDVKCKSFADKLKNLDEARVRINLKNFIDHITLLQKYFETPMDAIHCFYAMVGYWSAASKAMPMGQTNEFTIVDPNQGATSDSFYVPPIHQKKFQRFVETHYIFTNEGSGITPDNYFSRFDEVISRLDPDYTKQHGIFFTDHNLSKFAMWFVHDRVENKLSEKFYVFDPAGGSGNLVTSLDWRGHLKHKIVSELWPDLLKVIERRMRVHEDHLGKYTIIPKTVENKGLNFLDKTSEQYISELERVLNEKGLTIDKPLAFLLNPPYKSTDENVADREQVQAEYYIDQKILELTGSDAGRERYLAFLGQILNIAKYQNCTHPAFKPILMIFTPTSWLIPRPTYIPFRKIFDTYFEYVHGFIITSNEFFKIPGKWPLAFTIWRYNYKEEGNKNRIKVRDYTHLKREDLAGINWSARIKQINKSIKRLIRGSTLVNFSAKRPSIKSWSGQSMYDFKRSPTITELNSGKIYGGLPLTDPRRGNKKTYGIINSKFIGLMDNGTPVRIKPKPNDKRFRDSDTASRVWFRLDNDLKSINKTRILNGPPDKYGYCAYDLKSAQKTFIWFAITKAISGRYPIWVNQFDIWKPQIIANREKYFHSLCFAYGLSVNRCIVTKYEANNPVKDAPEVFVDNPLSTNNPDSFWNTTLDNQIIKQPKLAYELVESIKNLYNKWATNYCSDSALVDIGLKDEPYFKYFDYKDFLTLNSGLIQIDKYANIYNKEDLMLQLNEISILTKNVLNEIYTILTEDFNYFS
jgi:hypothetical protein